jgi:gamma-glutamyltranspeptidase/glutathione hydrolase
MMVGVLGGGLAHLRLADGRHVVVDGMSSAPLAASPAMFEAGDRRQQIGPLAVAVPGALKAWCATLAEYGSFSLDDVLQPALRWARRGFAVTPYLAECINDAAVDLALDAELAGVLLADGAPPPAGFRLVRADYAETLGVIARGGAASLYGGELGGVLADHMARAGGLIGMADLVGYEVVARAPVCGQYRGFDILGPPPPSSGGVHIAQMLNILEGFDIGGLGFGSLENVHLLAEVLKIAFADRAVATADPAFVAVPVDRLIAKAYAAERRGQIDAAAARTWTAGVVREEGANTTHVTVADRMGNIVASTQTINGLFGARFAVRGTGMIANNYMFNFDPTPGRVQSIAPGKRISTSMSPMIATRDGAATFALGLPGGLRIFGAAMQAILNLVDHGMSVQEAVEAPRVWTQGGVLEMEDAFSHQVTRALRRRGHQPEVVPHVGGGMNAIRFDPDGTMTGAACWRADGTVVGLGGGLAKPGVRFWPDVVRR